MPTQEKKSINVPFPTKTKEGLERMSKETGLSQIQLVLLATQSLIANYEQKGSFIFADLLNPEHRGMKD